MFSQRFLRPVWSSSTKFLGLNWFSTTTATAAAPSSTSRSKRLPSAKIRKAQKKILLRAQQRKLDAKKSWSAGPVDESVEVLVRPRRGERFDLQPRPPITPSPGEFVNSPNHPLWQFFRSQQSPLTPFSHYDNLGRGWEVAELRRKSYEDLHTLWYVCLKEINIINTERETLRRPYGKAVLNTLDDTINPLKDNVYKSMLNIRTVLLERSTAYQHAVKVRESISAEEFKARIDPDGQNSDVNDLDKQATLA
ncbi:mitochondrial 39-S ribosomal protein L47 (MRP-L47)-domain-containing protein [Lipomyces japonicus]|uniref:mitochondrial 54S ribosomal protein uL29m n=1 Tax=Lipomyces japonicus TaxID=56871 RepID=UPI0034CD07F0